MVSFVCHESDTQSKKALGIKSGTNANVSMKASLRQMPAGRLGALQPQVGLTVSFLSMGRVWTVRGSEERHQPQGLSRILNLQMEAGILLCSK